MSSPSMRACSACAGDYEDPDRTAWGDEEAVEEAADDASVGVNHGERGKSREQIKAPLTSAEEFPGR